MITKQQACQLLIDLVSEPSPSGAENKVAQIAMDSMLDLGFDATIDEAGNVVGARGPTEAPLVVLLGHIDTIPTILPTTVQDGVLHGRGAVDAKGPFATFISAVANIEAPKVRYLVIGAVEEETAGSVGAKTIREKYHPDAVIIGEPSGHDGFTIGYKGRLAGTFSVNCKSGHSAADMENANEIAIDFWQKLIKLAGTFNKEPGLFYSLQVSCDRLEGYQDNARLRFSLRLPPKFDIHDFLRRLAEISGAGALTLEEVIPAVLFSRTSPVARAMSRAIRKFDLKPRVKVKTGTCDMNVVCQRWHAEMIAYGPGDSSLDHTAEERINLEEFWMATCILKSALENLENEFSTSVKTCQEKELSE